MTQLISYGYVTFALKRLETHGTKRFHSKNNHQLFNLTAPTNWEFQRIPCSPSPWSPNCSVGPGTTKHGLTSGSMGLRETPPVLLRKNYVTECADSSCIILSSVRIWMSLANHFVACCGWLYHTFSNIYQTMQTCCCKCACFCCTRFCCSRCQDKNTDNLRWIFKACVSCVTGWLKTGRVDPSNTCRWKSLHWC